MSAQPPVEEDGQLEGLEYGEESCYEETYSLGETFCVETYWPLETFYVVTYWHVATCYAVIYWHEETVPSH